MMNGDGEPATTPSSVGAVLTVSQLHQFLRGALETAGMEWTWVSGVVTGLKRGSTVLELGARRARRRRQHRAGRPLRGRVPKEVAEITATLSGAGVELSDGIELAVWGRLDPNPAYGRLRLLAHAVDPRATVGAAVLLRERVVAELEASGELSAQSRLALPRVIRRVGLVSSATAAGRADVLAVLGRSPLPVDVVEAQAAMSGPSAPGEVARALDLLGERQVDVVLVARGGGARSDLAAWDSATVARAIARCPVPVVTALGHATDRTVADLAAHESHPTPSAAAAAVVVARAEAAVRKEEAAAAVHHHQVQLARARHRSRWAVAVALALAILVVLVVLA
jgi:exodeoxyribonuclease VII large subunit